MPHPDDFWRIPTTSTTEGADIRATGAGRRLAPEYFARLATRAADNADDNAALSALSREPGAPQLVSTPDVSDAPLVMSDNEWENQQAMIRATVDSTPLTENQIAALAPLADTPRNSEMNRRLSLKRRKLPLTSALVVDILDIDSGNKQAREYRQRLESLLEKGRAREGWEERRFYSSQRLKATLRNQPEVYVVDIEAIARSWADDSITFSRSGRNVGIGWTTEPITLACDDGSHEQALGRFKVSCILGSDVVQAQALEPNPAAGVSNVTHPHVRGGVMCVGNYRIKIAAAGREGRLGMLRRIVDGILNTYSEKNPFTKLTRWEATPCPNCGGYHVDDHSTCVQCGRAGCRDCFRWSNQSDCSVCPDCSLCCSSCDDHFPSNRRVVCTHPGCTRIHCPHCMRPNRSTRDALRQLETLGDTLEIVDAELETAITEATPDTLDAAHAAHAQAEAETEAEFRDLVDAAHAAHAAEAGAEAGAEARAEPFVAADGDVIVGGDIVNGRPFNPDRADNDITEETDPDYNVDWSDLEHDDDNDDNYN